MAKKKENSVKRSLYYYDFIWNIYDDSKGKFYSVKRKEEKLANFLEKFNFKKGATIEKKYILTTENLDKVFILVDKVEETYINFRIVLCKTNALPLVEEGGNLEDLEEYIDKKKNIAEITHCIFFKDSGIVGGRI